jgi:catechol 1,2-dioxygenase
MDSLVDEITFKLADEATDAPTATAILGPFFRADTPFRSNGESIVKTAPKEKDGKGEIAYMAGQVMDLVTKKPLVGAVVEVWQASTNGLYEQQDPEQEEFNLRGKFRTDENGRYSFYCLRPTPYPAPDDGPAGMLLKLMDRHVFRPAHIHIIVCSTVSSGLCLRALRISWLCVLCILMFLLQATHDGYRPLTTQIFDRQDPYLTSDAVFAVKESLIVDFIERKGDPQAGLELNFDVKLVPDGMKSNGA